MKDWNELQSYVHSQYKVTHQSEYLLFVELEDGSTALIQEGTAVGRDYETIRVEVSGFDDDEDSAYWLLSSISAAGNALLTCEELAGRLFVRHIVPTEVLTEAELDALLRWLASVAAQLRELQDAGRFKPRAD